MTDVLWQLFAVQAVLGFADIVLHHELTQRLAWRPTAATELTLHGWRNLMYVVIYLCLGWTVPGGWWVAIIAAVFAAEIVITFWDWVEEDTSRTLPASERIVHGILTINFGVIVALLAPVLWQWWNAPTGLLWITHGLWSWAASLFALVAGAFGVKDVLAGRRLAASGGTPESFVTDFEQSLTKRSTFLVTGATGLIGSRLVHALLASNHEVIVLTRDPQTAARKLGSPITIVTDLAQLTEDRQIDVIVHLAGESVAGGLWTKRRKHQMVESRTRIATQLLALIQRLRSKPTVWINASAVGWYAASDQEIDEWSTPGTGFAHHVCERAEAATSTAHEHGVRVVQLRLGLVLAAEGGYLGQLLPSFDMMLGTMIGNGNHWQSWVHIDDVVRAIVFACGNPSISGPVNVTAPRPVRFRQVANQIGHALHRPVLFRIPATLLKIALRDFADEILLASQAVMPRRLTESGFQFRYADIDSAVAACVNRRGLPPKPG